jgi:hypothetical protein
MTKITNLKTLADLYPTTNKLIRMYLDEVDAGDVHVADVYIEMESGPGEPALMAVEWYCKTLTEDQLEQMVEMAVDNFDKYAKTIPPQHYGARSALADLFTACDVYADGGSEAALLPADVLPLAKKPYFLVLKPNAAPHLDKEMKFFTGFSAHMEPNFVALPDNSPLEIGLRVVTYWTKSAAAAGLAELVAWYATNGQTPSRNLTIAQ